MFLDFKSKKGFTLIELILVIIILGVLVSITILLVDPSTQLKKSRDAKRYHDLNQMRTGLDSFQNDAGSYPSFLKFGNEFMKNETIYMKKVPQDPLCNSGDSSCSNDYLYVVDPNGKWFILFAVQEIKSMGFSECKFTCTSIPNIADYADRSEIDLSKYGYCVVGGDIDSNICPLKGTATPFYYGPTPTLTPAVTPTSVIPSPKPTTRPTPGSVSPTEIPTPTPFPSCQNGYYFCGCGSFGTTVCSVTFTRPDSFTYFCDSNCSGQCGQPCQ